jgi:hypothetical protein
MDSSIHRANRFLFWLILKKSFLGAYDAPFFVDIWGFRACLTQFRFQKAPHDPLWKVEKRPHCGRLWMRVGACDPLVFSCFLSSSVLRPKIAPKSLPFRWEG